MEKLRVGLLFGGRSVEHEVSIVSARSILSALDRTRYEVSLLGIDPDGRWHLADAETPLVEVFDAPEIFLPPIPAPGGSDRLRLDVLFPIVHGRGGEDGSLQGLLDLTEIPYVGSGVLSSAVQMDKDVAKRLLSAAGLPVTPWIAFSAARLAHDGLRAAADRAAEEIGLPAFVKPANSGSSVGISRADSVEDLVGALAEALRYDRKILVEAAVTAREIEVAVLG
ncbi:MAG: D-alanine--D-alanine ligase, partial [bacterium]